MIFFRYVGQQRPDTDHRLGDHQFYGPGSEFVLDTTKPFTVVTQVPFNALVMIFKAKMRIACGNFG